MDSVPGLRLTALLCATFLASEGCSAIFVRQAPRHGTVEAPECTSSVAAPVADSVVALGAATLGAAALGATIECRRQGNCGESLGPGLLGLSALVFAGAATSAVYGFYQNGPLSRGNDELVLVARLRGLRRGTARTDALASATASGTSGPASSCAILD